MRLILWLLTVCFFVSSLYVFGLFGFPLIGIYIPYPLLLRNASINPYSTWNVLVSLNFLPFVGIILSYLLFAFYAFVSVYIPNVYIIRRFLHEYEKYKFFHVVSLLFSLPFLFPLGFVMFTSYFFHSDIIFGPMEIVLGIILWIVWFRYRNNIFSKLFGVVAVSLAIFGVFFFMSESIPEFYPAVYGRFPLNDTKGVYMINYDGDYWLTYYSKQQSCIKKNTKAGELEKVCTARLVKKGNTVITESPTDLKKYLDKPVRVKGQFVKIMPPVPPGNIYRQLCITEPVEACTASHGPGTWYFSPLKISRIEVL